MSAVEKLRNTNPPAESIDERVKSIEWATVFAALNERGSALFDRLLTPDECDALAGLYDDDQNFRSKVVMARHGFGRGEYKYFDYPLPSIIAALRPALYGKLAPVAKSLERGDEDRGALPDGSRDFPRPMS